MIGRAGLRLLTRTVRPGRADIARLVAWSIVEAAPAYVTGRAVAGATDAFLAGRTGLGTAWLAGMVAAAGAGSVGARMVFGPLARIVEPFRDALVTRVVEGALREDAGDGTRAVSRLTHQVEIVRDTFGGMIMVSRMFLVTVVAAIAGLMSLGGVLPLFVVPPLAAGLVVFFAIVGVQARRLRAYVLAEERVSGSVTAAAAGIRDVVACGAEHRVAAGAGADIDDQARAAAGVAKSGAARMLCLAVGGWLPVALLVVAAPWLLGRGVTAGALLGALTYVIQAVQPALHTLTQGIGGSGVRLLVTLDRIVEATPEPSHHAAPETPAPPVRPAYRLRDVTFAYGPHAVPIVDGLSLDIPEGDHLAVAGPSGIGKSTLAALLAGLLRPGSGDVLLGGHPAADLPASCRVFVPQEAYVFAGTVRENLAYYGDAGVDAAVDLLGARDLVDRLGGLDAELDPGGLSGGERQLIAAVRAYLSPAPVAILDEATSEMTPSAEARVEAAFAARGTLIVIAHRLTSAERARHVLVMDGPRTVEGTHSVLARSDTAYRELTGAWGG